MNEYELIGLFCRIDDFCRDYPGVYDQRQACATSEVVLAAIIACRLFGGNFRQACQFLKDYRYCPKMLSESRFNRRLHDIPSSFWEKLMLTMSREHSSSNYIVDSFPVPTCRPARHLRARLFCGEEFRGYNSSHKNWFFGLKVHLIATAEGCPVSAIISPGSVHDLTALKVMDLELPIGSVLYGDKAYTDYDFEKQLMDTRGVCLMAQRKENSQRPHTEEIKRKCSSVRKLIETTISGIVRLMPRWIQAVTEQGFELKLSLFVIAAATIQLAS